MKLQPISSGLAVFVSFGALLLAAPACGDDDPPPDLGGGGVDAAVDPPPAPPPATPAADAGEGVVIIEVDCPVGTAVEIEDNDTPDKANELDQQLGFCGAITPGDDVDYSTFTTPPGKKLVLFQAVIDGAVDFDLVVNGKTLRPGDVKKFESGKYVVKAYTKDKEPGKYRYRIQYED